MSGGATTSSAATVQRSHSGRETSQMAMATLLQRIFTGKALSPASTQLLTGIMERNTTGKARIRARLPDGTVSFDGLWVGGGPVGDIAQGLPKGEKLPLKPEGVKLMEYRAQHESDDPHVWCMPMGIPRSTPYPFRWVQDITGSSTSAHMFQLHEGNIHSYRQIFMDGRKHPAELDPTWFGHSIGHWENKDTLVIDTVGFNDKFWFDRKGTPHSEQLHTIERWTRPRMDTMVNTVTIEDPVYYTKPFTVTFNARLQAPG